MTDFTRPRGWLRTGGRIAAVLLTLFCLSCSVGNPYYDPAIPHRAENGFRNNYLVGDIGGSFLKWQFERTRDGLPRPPANDYRFPVDLPDVDWIKANRSVTTATWIGHATMLVQLAGMNILTDPIFSERASPVDFAGPQRKVPPGLNYDQLPHVDVVVISHNHYDHLDQASAQRLNRQAGGPPLFLVPLGIKSWMKNAGITNVQELDWWQQTKVSSLDITFVPVQHWSARGVTDRFATLWGGWVVKTAEGNAHPFSLFFAGDTGYSKDFADIHGRFDRFDLALLPIGAYAPRWFMRNQHVDPAEAVQIHRDLHARQSLAIHWGTFELTDEPLDAPPVALTAELKKAGLPAGEFAVLRHGELRRF